MGSPGQKTMLIYQPVMLAWWPMGGALDKQGIKAVRKCATQRKKDRVIQNRELLTEL